MTEVIQSIQATSMQKMVQQLGIKLPEELPDYAERPKEEVYEEFATAVDRLLGTQKPDGTEGELSDGKVTLNVGSRLVLNESPGEPSDPYEAELGSDDTTYGPTRWLKLTSLLQINGVLANEIVTTGVRLYTSESYSGLLDERPKDSDHIKRDMTVSTLWIPPTASPAETAFGIPPNHAFNHDLYPNELGNEDGEIWRAWARRSGRLATDELYCVNGLSRSGVFGIGIEVLKHIEPNMLEIK